MKPMLFLVRHRPQLLLGAIFRNGGPWIATAIFAGVAIAATGPAPKIQPAPVFPVNLSPAWMVGQKFEYVADGSTTGRGIMTVTVPDRPVPPVQDKSKAFTLHFEADGETLAVFPNRTVQKEVFTVKVFRATLDEKAVGKLPEAGAKIVAERTRAHAPPVFAINGRLLKDNDGAANQLLNQLLLLATGNLGEATITDQEKFGPSGPVSVGSTWPVAWPNYAAPLTEDAKSDLGQAASAASATGTMKLESVVGEDASRVISVSGNLSVGGLAAARGAGSDVDYTAEIIGSYPASATQGVFKQNITANMTIIGSTSLYKIDREKTTVTETTKVEYVITFP